MSDPDLTEQLRYLADSACADEPTLRVGLRAARAELLRQQRIIELTNRHVERILPCPDCRDKVEQGKCERCARQAAEAKVTRLRAERDRLREALADLSAMCRSASVWPEEDLQGLRYHALAYAKRGEAALTPTEDR